MSEGLTGSSLIGAADVRPEGGSFRAVDPAFGAELEPAYGEAGLWIAGPDDGAGDERRAALT